jgi:ElaB/YqjD/DUF883 family membrane-anchored ribosome-binding protein
MKHWSYFLRKGGIIMTISAYDSSSISTLFSSLGSSSSSSSGVSDLLGISYSDYASIKSGSYGKLLKAYYALDSDSSTKSSSSDSTEASDTSTSTSKDTSKVLASIESGAEELTDTAKELYTRSNNKVFKKDASGNYDTDTIYNKVSDFVEDYNTLLTSAAKSSTSKISSALSSMKNLTETNETSLSEIGISVNSKSGTLSIDADTFKSADMDKVKNLFNGTGSYAYGVATQSAMIDSYAQAEASKSNTYDSSGSYTYNFSSGSIISAFA